MTIPISAIVFDAGTQVRASIHEPTVAKYAERMTEGDVFPPIDVFHDGNAYHLADGFHRFMAAQRIKLLDIPATVHPGTKDDALWFALGANRTNAHPMTDADKKHAIVLALATWPERSQNQLAQQIGCSQRYVSTIKDEVRSTSNLPDRVTGKDGKSYPASRKVATTPAENVAPVDEPFKSRANVDRRRARIKAMAAEGFTVSQISAELHVSEDTIRHWGKSAGIDFVANRVMGKPQRHDANRIVSTIVMDAHDLTGEIDLIDFGALDRSQLAEWIESLHESKRALVAFIKKLEKESATHGQAA